MLPVLALGALLLAGCEQDASTQAIPPIPETPQDYAALVNGEAITDQEVEAFRASREQAQPGLQVDRNSALEELIAMRVLEREAVRKGLDQNEAVRTELARERTNILVRATLRDFADNVEISEEELRAEYDRQVAELSAQEYKARHILVEEEARARELIVELDGGADFSTLAEEHSTGPSAPRGGDLGWFRTDTMVPPFAEAVTAMEPGSYSAEPVQTQFGWHIISLDEVRGVEPPPFESVRPRLEQAMGSQRLQQYVRDLREGANVEINTSAPATQTP
jgi:peptidyl-prolyl cis-trans isomerase C